MLKIKEENRQIRIDKFIVDGYDPTNKIIYEFLGDYWHGNPVIFPPDDYNSRAHKTFGELYEFCFNYKFKTLKENGYCVKYLWECDWDNKKYKLIVY